jgi:hypothetical protein
MGRQPRPSLVRTEIRSCWTTSRKLGSKLAKAARFLPWGDLASSSRSGSRRLMACVSSSASCASRDERYGRELQCRAKNVCSAATESPMASCRIVSTTYDRLRLRVLIPSALSSVETAPDAYSADAYSPYRASMLTNCWRGSCE